MTVKFESMKDMAEFVVHEITKRQATFRVSHVQRMSGVNKTGDAVTTLVRAEDDCTFRGIRVEESKGALVFNFDVHGTLIPMIKRKAVATFPDLDNVLEAIATEHFGLKTFAQMEQSVRAADKRVLKKAQEERERLELEAKIAAQAEKMSGNSMYGSW